MAALPSSCRAARPAAGVDEQHLGLLAGRGALDPGVEREQVRDVRVLGLRLAEVPPTRGLYTLW